jgi:hypothetical protein
MRLLFLCDAPTARRFQRDRAANREPHGSIGVSYEVLTFNEFEQILASPGNVAG